MIRVEEIANKDFKSVIWGYDPQSVDAYLDEIITLILQMQQERVEMMSTIDYLVTELGASAKGNTKGPHNDPVVEPMSPHAPIGERKNEEEQ